jgi:hypothetical protein
MLFLCIGLLGSCGPIPNEDDWQQAMPHTVGSITAPSETWTWVPFASAICANDSPTGIGVNLTSRSSRVLIYLEGGGGCWDAGSCADQNLVQNANLNGFDETTFRQFLITGASQYNPPIAANYGGTGLWNRADINNPFKDYNYVYVPYCTADFHSGNSPRSPITGRSHVGAANYTAFLDRLVPTFAAAEKVVLSGSSAGGFGANWNYQRTRAAFGSVPVVLLDQSGPPLPFKNSDGKVLLPQALQDKWAAAWNLDATKPVSSRGTMLGTCIFRTLA